MIEPRDYIDVNSPKLIASAIGASVFALILQFMFPPTFENSKPTNTFSPHTHSHTHIYFSRSLKQEESAQDRRFNHRFHCPDGLFILVTHQKNIQSHTITLLYTLHTILI